MNDAGPLRVLHVDSAREWRGGQNQVRLLAKELRRRPGVEQAVAARGGSRLADEVRALSVDVAPLPWGPALDPRAVVGLARLCPDRDVVHAHGSHALQAALLALAASGAPARLVAARRTDLALRSAAVWRRADLVLAVSDAARRTLIGSGLSPGRVRVVPDGVDPDELDPASRGALRAAAGVPDAAPLVGSVGALEVGKDHATFVRAAAIVAGRRADVRFVIAGDGPERTRLERLARREGLGGRLALPGHVPDVARSLADLDLFVMCSRREGMGSAALEALAAGVPVVLARAGGLAEIAGETLPSVPAGDPGALAEAVDRLLGDDDARAAAVRAGERRVAEFGIDRTADATLRAYRDVVDAAARRREWRARMDRAAAWRRARPPVG